MNDQRQNANLVHKHDIFRETCREGWVRHGVSTKFDYYDFPSPPLDIGKYLDEHLRVFHVVCDGLGVYFGFGARR
uniref:Uncharacterized protein n=1 Tax=uncultured actinobacterium HF0200_20K23 TaxID=711001 RepID=E0XUH5_9ACTN|nr:hypothetical protein [uncultured actinobacterium HF0200_20K23]